MDTESLASTDLSSALLDEARAPGAARDGAFVIKAVGIIAMLLGFALQGYSGGLKMRGEGEAARFVSGFLFLLNISGWGLVWVALNSPWGELGAADPTTATFRLGNPGGLGFLGLLRILGLIATGMLPVAPKPGGEQPLGHHHTPVGRAK
jgi:hypothetical protein